MTRRDVLVQILSEVSGKPKELVRSVVGVVPPSPAMDDQLPDGEGEQLLQRLQQEKPGILNWLIEGRRKALIRIHDAAMRN